MRRVIVAVAVLLLFFAGSAPTLLAQADLDTEYEVAMTKGIMELETGNIAAAIEFFKQARAAKPAEKNAVLSLGIAYSRSVDLAKARETLQQALSMDPSDARTRYELGVVLLRTGAGEKARELLDSVAKDTNASPALKSASRGRLGQTADQDRAKRFVISLLAGIEYDSNVILEPTVPISPSGEKKGDWSAVASAEAVYRFFPTEATTAELAYQFYQSLHFTIEDYNVQQHTLRAAARHRVSDRLTAGAIYNFLYTFMGAEHYSTLNEVMPYIDMRFSSSSTTQFRYRLQDNAYYDGRIFAFNSDRSGMTNALGITHTVAVRPLLSVSAAYDYSASSADKDYWSYSENRGQVGIQTTAGDYLIAGRASYTDQRYDQPLPGYPAKRHDGMQEYAVSVTRGMARNLSLTLSAGYTINDSNLAAFEYTRSIGGLFVGMRL